MSSVAGLYLVLEDVAEVQNEGGLDAKREKDLSLLIQNCSDVLQELDAIIKKHESLASKSQRLSARFRIAWDRVHWDQAEVKELRDRIVLCTISLNTFIASLIK